MAAFDDDDRPKKKVAHEIGQELSLLSVEELALRIQLMQDEIKRLEADVASSRTGQSSRSRSESIDSVARIRIAGSIAEQTNISDPARSSGRRKARAAAADLIGNE